MSVLVITPTTGSNDVIDAIHSVLNQTIEVDHLLVCDGDEFKHSVQHIVDKVVEHPRVKACYLPYNTGGHGFYGHRIMAAFGHLVNHDHILFLDQDNWYEPGHVESLVYECNKFKYEWSYSLRKIYTKEKEYVCDDNCESLGRWPVWLSTEEKTGYLIDSSSYCFTRQFLVMVGHLWHWGWGGDRRFYSIVKDQIQHKNYGCTNQYTLNYRLGGNEGSVQKEFFLKGNEIMRQKYHNNFPWSQRYDILY